MSNISANIVVEQNNLTITPSTNQLNITPEAIQLNVVAGGGSGAGTSNNGELLYNNVNIIGGVANTSFSNGNLSLGDVANVKIVGGTNGFVLQTDGTGNLTWTAQTGNGGGNGSPGGANTQIQYNDSGLFGGAAGFTFNEVSGDVAIPGNLSVVGNITGNVATANSANFAGVVLTNAQPNITSVGTLVLLDVNGNITAPNITANTGIFTGNGSGISALNASNISTGTLSNARLSGTYTITVNGSATTAGTVTTAAQPNITSVGTLTNLNVDGTTSIFEAIENVALIGAQTGTYNYNVLDGAIQFSTANATANVVLNFRGNGTTTLNTVLGNAKSSTVTYVMTTGATPYTITGIQIDSSAQSIKWVNGVIPPLNGSSTTAYTFTLIKTSTTPTYTILGSATRYA